MDQQPAPPPDPLLEPSTRCFHCGGQIPSGANFCPSCGSTPGVTAENERGYIAYLLTAVDDWTRTRGLSNAVASRLTARYRKQLGEPDSVGQPHPTAPPAPPRQPVNFTVIWANALLYVGAFFVVIATLFFLLIIGNNLGRTIIMAGLAGLFLATGLIARRVEIVRTAGATLTAVGAMLVPIVFIAFVIWLQDSQRLPENQLWLLATIACFLLYLAFTLTGFGKFYAVLTLISFSAAASAAFRVADPFPEWLGSWWGGQALVLAAVHYGFRRFLQRPFGPLVLIWSIFWSLATFAFAIPVSFYASDPAPAVWPLLFLIAVTILIAWRQRDPVSPVFAGLLIHLAAGQVVRWAEGPEWAGSLSVIALATGQIGFWWFRRGTTIGREQLVIGMIAAFLALSPPIYGDVEWVGAGAGLYVTSLLGAVAILTRKPWLLVPPALTLAVGWSFLLQAIGLTKVHEFGLGFLVVVAGLVLAAVVLPLRLTWWRWTTAAIAAAYALVVAMLTLPEELPSATAAWTITALTLPFVARWRNPPLLAIVGGGLIGAIAATLRWLDSPIETLGPLLSVVAIGWVLAGHALAGRFGRWSAAARLVGLGTGLFAIVVAGAAQAELRDPDRRRLAGHLTALTMVVLALLVGLEVRWRRLALYPASFLALVAVLWELAVFKVDNPQWYAVPAGVYFAVVAILSARDRDLGTSAPILSAFAWVIGALTIGLTSLGQTFGDDAFLYGVVLIGQCFALLGVGAVVRSRALLATTVLLMVLGGLRLLFAEPAAIPFVLFCSGFTLLGVGVVALIFVGRRRARTLQAEPDAAVASSDPL
ncbi:MAG: zinc ribbon domain-containing protein [Dehalococcoidia bacterium]